MSDDEWNAEADQLIDEFAAWVGDRGIAEDARIALWYKREAGDGRLRRWTRHDVEELLLVHAPAKAVLDEEEARATAEHIARFLEFLGHTGCAGEGSDAAADLASHVRSLIPEFLALMADPSVGGPSKGILKAMLADGVDIEDAEAVEEWITRFDQRPIEQRDAVLRPPPDMQTLRPGIELPPAPAVDIEDARLSAAQAELLHRLVALAEYMGEGRRLTDAGNVRLADARALVELLETGDTVEGAYGDRVVRTPGSTELPWLDMTVWWARTAGAVEVRNNRMSATKAWLERAQADALAVMEEAASLVFSHGPLYLLWGDREGRREIASVLDASAVPVLGGTYGGERPFESLVEAMTEGMPRMVELPGWYLEGSAGDRLLDRLVRADVGEMVRVMEIAGLLRWQDAELIPVDMSPAWRGGVLAATPFGRWMLQNPLAERGAVAAPVFEPLTVSLDDPPEQIVAGLAGYVAAGPAALVQAWEELGGWDGLPDFLWRVDDDATSRVLEALGSWLPDKRSAKAARLALVKHRSHLGGT